MTLRNPSPGFWARSTRLAIVGAVLALPGVAYTYDLPGADFEPGTPISAQAVNAKLHALLEAVVDLDETVPRLGADAHFETLTVGSLEITGRRPSTTTHWADRGMVWTVGQNSSNAVSCNESINGRPGCVVDGFAAAPRVVMPLDHVRDGTLVEWGMHIGTSNTTGTPVYWTCDLRYNETSVSSISLESNAGAQWSRFVQRTDLEIPIDNYADGPALTTGFRAGWDVLCEASNNLGRFDVHQIYLTVIEG
jgi:hypothetical protein